MALDHNAVVTELWRRINEALTIPLQTAATAASDALLAQIAAEAARDEVRAAMTTKADITYVDAELEGKADQGHTHTSADITDAVSNATESGAGKLVAWDSERRIQTLDPVGDANPATKKYVDRVRDELGEQIEDIDSGLGDHLHLSEDITDATETSEGPASAKMLVRWGNSGNIATKAEPTSDDHLTRKQYVDTELEGKADIDELAKYDKAVVYLSFERTKTTWQWLIPSSPWWNPDTVTFAVPPGDYHVIVENAYYTATGLQFNALPSDDWVVKMPDTKWHEFDISLPEGSTVQSQDSRGDIGERLNIFMIPTRMWEAFSVESRRENEEQNAAVRSYVDQEVSKKADTGHKHASSDVSDAANGYTLTSVATNAGRLVEVSGNGTLEVHPANLTNGNAHAVTNKKYVDEEVAQKADVSHTHSLSDISGIPNSSSPSALANTVVTRNSSGHFSVAEPASNSHAASKSYVDNNVPWIGSQSAYNSVTKSSGRLYVIT